MKNLNLFQWAVIVMLVILLIMSVMVLVQIFEIKSSSPTVEKNTQSGKVPGMIRTQEFFEVPVVNQTSTENSAENSPTNSSQGEILSSAMSMNKNFPTQTHPVREWTNEEIQELIHSRHYREYGVQWKMFQTEFPDEHMENKPLREGENGLQVKVRLEFLERVTDITTGQIKQIRIYPSRVYIGPGLKMEGGEGSDPVILVSEAQDLWFCPIFHGHGIQEPDPQFPKANPPAMIVPDIPKTFTVMVIYQSVQRKGETRSFELTTDYLYDDPRHDKYSSAQVEYFDGYRITWESFLQDTPIKRK